MMPLYVEFEDGWKRFDDVHKSPQLRRKALKSILKAIRLREKERRVLSSEITGLRNQMRVLHWKEELADGRGEAKNAVAAYVRRLIQTDMLETEAHLSARA